MPNQRDQNVHLLIERQEIILRVMDEILNEIDHNIKISEPWVRAMSQMNCRNR